jgi:signal transduction histidine kinase
MAASLNSARSFDHGSAPEHSAGAEPSRTKGDTNAVSGEGLESACASAGDRANILLVDDRPDKLMAFETILASLEQNLVLAHSGTEALRHLLQQEFAVIMLDVSMPGMDGFETASLIRQRKNSELTPIIFISAVNYSDTHLSRGYSLGAVDYILAPIVPEILRAKVSFFIELHRKTEQLKRQAETQAQLIREQAARAEAEAANKAKDRFLAMLSHELRTPLTPILFASTILSQDPTVPEHIREELKIVARNVELEARLIDDLLDLTQITQGKLNLTFKTVDAHELLHSALEVCANEISAKGLTIRFELEAVGKHIQADGVRLRQVVWNLIKNAVKFTPTGGQIRLRSSNPQRSWFRLEVIDSGIGIAPDVLPRIYDPFEQAGSAGGGGLGLGLTISKAIVELHEGRISASSAGLGHGAMFAVELPEVDPISAEPPSALKDIAAPTHHLAERAENRFRILLVDDHLDSVRPMQLFLEAIGYRVTTAESVEGALRIAAKEEFDLLVSDIGLPDGSGVDLLRLLREKGHTLPGIALSGYGMEQDLTRSHAAGFQVHLVKPVLPQHLRSTIDQLTRQRSSPLSAAAKTPPN